MYGKLSGSPPKALCKVLPYPDTDSKDSTFQISVRQRSKQGKDGLISKEKLKGCWGDEGEVRACEILGPGAGNGSQAARVQEAGREKGNWDTSEGGQAERKGVPLGARGSR